MMLHVRQRVRLLSILLLLLALAPGCGDSSPATPDAGPLPENQCIGASDLAIIEALASAQDGGIPDGGVADGGPYPYSFLTALGDQVNDCATASTCLPAIIADDDPSQCINDCLSTTPASGVSGGCVDCYVEIIRCTGQYCTTECLGSDPALCAACGQLHCGDRMAICTGIEGRP